MKIKRLLLMLSLAVAIPWVANAQTTPILPQHGEIGNQDASETTVTQTIALSEGWNWVSFYVVADDLLAQLETGLGENGVTIKSKTQNALWDEDEEEWYGQLRVLTNDMTYMVRTSAACTVNLTGRPAEIGNYTLTINSGWNWIGFPSAESMSVAQALASFEAMDGDRLKSKNKSTLWDEDEEEWYGQLVNLEPGQGLMLYSASTSPRELVFQTGTGTKGNTLKKVKP